MKRRHFSRIILGALLLGGLTAHAHDNIQYAYDSLGRLIYVDLGAGKYIRYYYDVDSNLVARQVIGLTDTDDDSMDDAWETAFFGDLSRDGTGDQDGDGEKDYNEFISQTDPTDAKSKLRIRGELSESGPALLVEWDAVPGLEYELQSNSALNPAEWTTVTTLTADAAQVSFAADLPGVGESAVFYRVVPAP